MNQGGPGVGGQNLVPQRRWLADVAMAAVGLLAAAGCSSGGNASAAGTTSPAHSNTKNVASNGPTSSKSSAKSTPAAKLSISPGNGTSDVRPDAPIAVTATNGTIRNVSVHSAGDTVTGSMNASKTSWHSAATLNVGQSYTVTA